MTTSICLATTETDARVRAAAEHVYDAECALQVAYQTEVDEWIAAAATKLHDSIAEHLAALADAGHH